MCAIHIEVMHVLLFDSSGEWLLLLRLDYHSS